LLLAAWATVTLAQTAPPTQATTATSPAKSAATTAAKQAVTKPVVAKITTKKPAPAHPAKALATAKLKPPVKQLAAAPKKTMPEKKLAAAAPKPALPSYTVTTTRGNVTYTTTRLVPLPATPTAATPPETKVAVVPVSLTQAVATAIRPPEKPVVEKPAVERPVVERPVVERPVASAPEKPATRTPATATPPSDSAAGASFVTNFLKEAFRIAKSDGTTSLQRRAQLADLFASKMDVKFIAGYTTADELTGASADLQQHFRTILVSYLVETYYPRLELASGPSITVETTPGGLLADGTSVVWTSFTKDGWGSQSVKWHLMAEDGGFKIVDIFSAGASLVQMERDTFVSVMRNGGLNELMAKLDERTKKLASAATE
jgi:ABC-type transporter MlaC component